MSAEGVVQAALVAVLEAGLAGSVNGVFAGRPARVSPPYAIVGEVIGADWGTKSARGRELRVAVTLRDAHETAARAIDLGAAAGDAIEVLPRDLDGWRVGSVAFVRSRVLRESGGSWAVMIEHRVRVMEVL